MVVSEKVLSTEKKKKKRKVATYVSFGDLSEETPWDTASHIAARNCFKELREEPGYPGVLLEKNNKHTHKHPTPPPKKKRKPTPYCHT